MLFALILYAILEIILETVFWVWFFIRQEIVSYLESIQFTQKPKYSGLKKLPVLKVSRKSSHVRRNKIQAKELNEKWNV